MSEEILDLSKVADRDTIRLPSKTQKDGKSYKVINRSDLGVFEYAALTQMQAEANRLTVASQRGKLTAKQDKDLLNVLGDCVTLLIPSIEPAVLEVLERPAREQIVLTWLGRNFTGEELSGVPANPPKRRTGAASSRASKRSTAATRKHGSTSRRGS